MDYEKQYKSLQNRVSNGIVALSCVFMLLICTVICIAAIYVQIQFNVIQYILKQELALKLMALAIGVVFALMITVKILQSICGLMTLTSNSINDGARFMLLLSSEVFDATFVIGGLFFVGCGFYVMLVGTVTGGTLFILMGAIALLAGLFMMYRDTVCYLENGFEIEVDPGSKRYKLNVIGKYLIPLGCGAVFCYFPIFMLEIVLNSDESIYAKIGIMGMGLIFLGVGAYILYFVINTIKKKLKKN